MSDLNREDAYYFKILLTSGFRDGYDEWLDGYLEAENPLSDIVLNLSLCGSDINKTISCLHNYCAEQDFDESIVCEKLRIFLKDAYNSNRLNKEETVAYMYRFAVNHCNTVDFNIDSWGSMFYLDDYHSLAEEGIISWESFDFAFLSYLNEGTPLDSDLIWSKNSRTKPSLFDRIKSIFKK